MTEIEVIDPVFARFVLDNAGLEELAASIRDFTADVRDAMTQRESELRESTGMAGDPGRPDR